MGLQNNLKLVAMIAQVYKFTKNHRIIHFLWVHFMVFKLYLYRAIKKLQQNLTGGSLQSMLKEPEQVARK